MNRAPRRSRVPQVNLLSPPPGGFRLPLPPHAREVALVVLAVLVWGTAAVGLAMLLGWRPPFGGGP
jgi:hypothetical protein